MLKVLSNKEKITELVESSPTLATKAQVHIAKINQMIAELIINEKPSSPMREFSLEFEGKVPLYYIKYLISRTKEAGFYVRREWDDDNSKHIIKIQLEY